MNSFRKLLSGFSGFVIKQNKTVKVYEHFRTLKLSKLVSPTVPNTSLKNLWLESVTKKFLNARHNVFCNQKSIKGTSLSFALGFAFFRMQSEIFGFEEKIEQQQDSFTVKENKNNFTFCFTPICLKERLDNFSNEEQEKNNIVKEYDGNEILNSSLYNSIYNNLSEEAQQFLHKNDNDEINNTNIKLDCVNDDEVRIEKNWNSDFGDLDISDIDNKSLDTYQFRDKINCIKSNDCLSKEEFYHLVSDCFKDTGFVEYLLKENEFMKDIHSYFNMNNIIDVEFLLSKKDKENIVKPIDSFYEALDKFWNN